MIRRCDPQAGWPWSSLTHSYSYELPSIWLECADFYLFHGAIGAKGRVNGGTFIYARLFWRFSEKLKPKNLKTQALFEENSSIFFKNLSFRKFSCKIFILLTKFTTKNGFKQSIAGINHKYWAFILIIVAKTQHFPPTLEDFSKNSSFLL